MRSIDVVVNDHGIVKYRTRLICDVSSAALAVSWLVMQFCKMVFAWLLLVTGQECASKLVRILISVRLV